MVRLTDVVLRDGLQDEDVVVSTDDKVDLARAIAEAGVRELEVASFVSPRRIPQMADSADVVTRLRELLDVRLIGIALNGRGITRAADSDVDELRLVLSATDGHSTANAGATPTQLMSQYADTLAHTHVTAEVSAAVSVAFTCPYDGGVEPGRVVDLVGGLRELGIARVSLADTLGTASPGQVSATLVAVREAYPELSIGLHLHDALGQALEIVGEALALGVDQFDCSLGGIGGCPFAPGAHGNLDTRRLVDFLESAGYATGVDPAGLESARGLLQRLLGRTLALR